MRRHEGGGGCDAYGRGFTQAAHSGGAGAAHTNLHSLRKRNLLCRHHKDARQELG